MSSNNSLSYYVIYKCINGDWELICLLWLSISMTYVTKDFLEEHYLAGFNKSTGYMFVNQNRVQRFARDYLNHPPNKNEQEWKQDNSGLIKC